MGTRRWVASVAAALALSALAANAADAGTSTKSTTAYTWDDADGYAQRWFAGFGPGEGDVSFGAGSVTVDATPFTTSADFSVFDHLKYLRVSTSSFAVPTHGSLEFSVDIAAATPGTQPRRTIVGCYGAPSSWQEGEPCARPWSGVALEGQQAGVVLNMINFETGQLFDWFVSGNRVFALIERLPSTVTGSPSVVGLDKAYTQIIKEAPIAPGRTVNVAIRYTRGPGVSKVEYLLDGKLFATVDRVGVPLDVQGVRYTGYAPSLGAGEQLSLDSFVIGHGLFSLLDAFPYQHPDRPDLSVSIPISQRLFGQGAVGTWSDFKVVTRTR